MSKEKLSINHARELGKRLGSTGVVVISFEDSEVFGIASYGNTKENCTTLGSWIDDLYEWISWEGKSPKFKFR